MQDALQALESEVRLHEETRNAMHDTLVNHKRSMLMEHKVQALFSSRTWQLSWSRRTRSRRSAQLF